VCESVRYCIIEKVNFVVKISYGVGILAYNKVLMIFISLTGGVQFAVSSEAVCMRFWQDI